MRKVHRVAKVGEKVTLCECMRAILNPRAAEILEGKVATVIGFRDSTVAITDLGDVYHAWYEVIEEQTLLN